MNRTQKELKALKIQGTQFDRRRKLTKEDREQIADLWAHKDEIGITAAEIAEAFGISMSHLGRCKSQVAYETALAQNRVHVANYFKAMDEQTRAEKKKKANESCYAYKNALLDIIDKYSRSC